MGGYGSGRPKSHNRPETVERTPRLPVRALHRFGDLEPGRETALSGRWFAPGVETVILRPDEDELRVIFHRSNGADTHFWITLDWEPVAAPGGGGGRRPWALCPSCSGRVASLYIVGGRFQCRTCAGLRYTSQYEGVYQQCLRRSNRIRGRVCPLAGNYLTPFPERPRGMHHATYNRLWDAAIAAEERAAEAMLRHYGAASSGLGKRLAVLERKARQG